VQSDLTMNRVNLWIGALVLAAMVLSVSREADAQLQTGNLYGTVTDEAAAVLPGVAVTLRGIGAPQVQMTDAQGQFRFPGLAPGSYTLEAELEGYSTAEYPNISVSVGINTTIEVMLSPADVRVSTPRWPASTAR
jgi:hypothetical protein